MSYLQLLIRREDNKLCSRCGETGHWKCCCRATTWCRFCTPETHAMQASRKYANFMRDNPIASSRRTTPVQEQRRSVQPDPPCVNVQQQQQYQQIRDNCSHTHQLNASNLRLSHQWKQGTYKAHYNDSLIYKEVAKTFTEILISNTPLHNIHSCSSIDNHNHPQ